jgi:hypothetical protein
MQWLSNAADVIGILGGIFAFFAWLQSRRVSKALEAERERKEKKIRVILCYDGEKLELPTEMRRSEFSRAELLGRLGMLPTENGKRFSLSYLNTAEFLKSINEINSGYGDDTMLIPCTYGEIRQFQV